MAPFKSEAQRRKFAELVKQGKLTQGQFNEWNKATPKDIPERLSAPKPKNAPNAIPMGKTRKTR